MKTFNTLNEYVEQMNRWNSIFGTENMDFPLRQQNVNDLMNKIAGELSPENLCCDGELSHSAVQQKFNYLTTVRTELEQYCLDNWLETPECVYQGLTNTSLDRILYRH